MKTAIINGSIGQDGYYLTKFLVKKDYKITLWDKIFELDNKSMIENLIKTYKPDEFYHLAADSIVDSTNYKNHKPFYNNVESILNVLTTIKTHSPKTKVFFAGSSEQFGTPNFCPQDENTYFNPRSLYGISKVVGYNLINYFKQKHGIFGCTGIMYNHESPLRPFDFVTQKIIQTALKIKKEEVDYLELGNIGTKRDWGYAEEYVEAMWLMLQNEKPKNYVIGTGKLHSVEDFVNIVFEKLDLNMDEHLISASEWREDEIIPLCADPSSIKKDLGWEAKVQLPELIDKMLVERNP